MKGTEDTHKTSINPTASQTSTKDKQLLHQGSINSRNMGNKIVVIYPDNNLDSLNTIEKSKGQSLNKLTMISKKIKRLMRP